VDHYLATSSDPELSYQLARKVADLFDQYSLYRPAMVLGWDAGREEHWQAQLWREIVTERGISHLARASQLAFSQLASHPTTSLPPRLILFGFSSLPPLFLEWFSRLSARLELHLFAFSPSSAWLSHGTQHLEMAGATCLHSFARLGAEFQDLLEEIPYLEKGELFQQPQGSSLLARLQRRWVTDEPPGPGEERESVQIHAYHSPRRECMGLRQYVLERFRLDPSLTPEDVLVLASDLETYAPHFEAEWARDPSDPTFIPFSIADRPLRLQGALTQAWRRLLELMESRFEREEVLDLLGTEAIQARLGTHRGEWARLAESIREVGVEWGLTPQHRADWGGLACLQNSWAFGLGRLLVATCLPAGAASATGLLAPHEGTELELRPFSRLLALWEKLRLAQQDCQEDRELARWQDWALELMAVTLPQHGEFLGEFLALRHLVLDTCALAEAGTTLPYRVFHTALEHAMSARVSAGGFLSGGVTLCAMLPMRGVPHRVVCLLGLNRKSFPRSRIPSSLDLMAASPQKGDRNPAREDRFLFLEAIEAARQWLYLSYVGFSSEDNAPEPPAQPLVELMEELAQLAGSPLLPVQHPLHAHDVRYFQPGGELFSFEWRDYRILCGELGAWGESSPLAGSKLGSSSPPTPRDKHAIIGGEKPDSQLVELENCLYFWRNPTRYFLLNTCKLEPPPPRRELRQGMATDKASKRALARIWITRLLEGVKEETIRFDLLASGRVPAGQLGRHLLEMLELDLRPWRQKLDSWSAKPKTISDVSLTIGGFQLVGRLAHCAGRQEQFHYGTPSAGTLIEAWMRHLVLCLHEPGASYHLHSGEKADTIEERVWSHTADAERRLLVLLQAFQIGQRQPLPLFPQSSLAFARAVSEGAKDPMLRACSIWQGRENEGERDRWENLIAHRDLDLGSPHSPNERQKQWLEQFAQLAEEFLAPIMAESATIGHGTLTPPRRFDNDFSAAKTQGGEPSDD
jgi:exodeoxyribonuclease V gamma subunit